jgi:hypothetical protein
MDQYLKWEQLTLMQQLNCVCNTLAKKSITTAIIHGYHTDSLSSFPKKMWLWLYGALKSLAISCPLCGFMQEKRWQENIWQLSKRTSGQTGCFDVMDWEHLDLALKNKADMYKCGSPSNIWVSAVQGFRLAVTSVSCFLTSNAQIADNGRQQHTSCSALMMTTPDYWLKMLTN